MCCIVLDCELIFIKGLFCWSSHMVCRNFLTDKFVIAPGDSLGVSSSLKPTLMVISGLLEKGDGIYC